MNGAARSFVLVAIGVAACSTGGDAPGADRLPSEPPEAPQPTRPAAPSPSNGPALPAAFLGRWFFAGASGGITGGRTDEPATGYIEIHADNTLATFGEDGTALGATSFRVTRGRTIFSTADEWMLQLGLGSPLVARVAADGSTLSLDENVYDGLGRSYVRRR